ncbi:MAG: outer membrane protein transport protein [Sulfuriflexus sp.]|nr:outer membrane protein transport protein [Sulfuriflexus sp.]
MSRINTPYKVSLLAASISLAAFSGTANAAAFGIVEQSVTGLGAAFSTGSTAASDGSTIFYNPAGMSFLNNRNAADFGAHVIDPNAKFKNAGSSYVLGGNLTGGNGGDAGPVALVPNFYYTRAINDKWTAGVGINAPFGLVTEYDDGWVGRYHALTSDLKTININPSLSYKANNSLSFGFGVNIQYIKAALSNAVDFGGICRATQAAATCNALNLEAQADDGEAEVTGDDWSFGYNLGLLWQATPETRIGVAYRSRIKHKLEGDVDFDNPTTGNAAPIAAGAGLVDGDVTAKITLPDSLSVGFQHAVNNKLTINGDVTWTNWSVLKELRVDFDNTLAADSVTTLEYDDSNRYSLGITYAQDSKWTWRAGVAFDESTAPNAELVSIRTPDADRTWLTAGFTYKPSKKMSVDFGIAHLFIDDAEVRKTATGEDQLKGGLVGEYEIDANIISAQMRWSF